MQDKLVLSKKQKIVRIYGWVFVRPRRWLFWRMVAKGSFGLRLIPRKREYIGFGRDYPNLHWWILYKTIFNLFSWMYWDAWRLFCDWTGGYRRSYPLIARIIHRIGATTSGYVISGGECFHCASERGCEVDLSEDETGVYFKLEKTWSEGTMDGTDHRFCGTTICPDCGLESYYEAGSL